MARLPRWAIWPTHKSAPRKQSLLTSPRACCSGLQLPVQVATIVQSRLVRLVSPNWGDIALCHADLQFRLATGAGIVLCQRDRTPNRGQKSKHGNNRGNALDAQTCN